MKKIIFVDTQYDFMNHNGKLYVPGAENLVVNLHALKDFFNDYDQLYTFDCHSKDDKEFETFPPHCIEFTNGYENVLDNIRVNATELNKSTYDIWNEELGDPDGIKEFIERGLGDPDYDKCTYDDLDVYICGVATDICVKATVEGLIKRHIPTKNIHIITDACAGLNRHQETLDDFQNQGVKLVKTKDVVKL